MKIIYRLTGLLVFLLLWYMSVIIGKSLSGNSLFDIFQPFSVFGSCYAIIKTDLFWSSLTASLRRVCVSLLAAFLIGFPFGLLIGNYKIIRALTHLPIQIIRMISPLSWMPLAVLILPDFESAIYFLITATCVWPIILNTSHGVKQIPTAWIHMAKNQGASPIQLFTNIIFPAIRPFYMNGIRLSLGIAWIILVPAEFLGISQGLGYLINNYRDAMRYDNLMAIVLVIGIIGFLLDAIIQFFQNKFSWKQ